MASPERVQLQPRTLAAREYPHWRPRLLRCEQKIFHIADNMGDRPEIVTVLPGLRHHSATVASGSNSRRPDPAGDIHIGADSDYAAIGASLPVRRFTSVVLPRRSADDANSIPRKMRTEKSRTMHRRYSFRSCFVRAPACQRHRLRWLLA